jgi:hypothetical protein
VSYLSGYLKEDQPLPNYSLDAVLKAAGKVEGMATGRFRPKQKEKKPLTVAARLLESCLRNPVLGVRPM